MPTDLYEYECTVWTGEIHEENCFFPLKIVAHSLKQAVENLRLITDCRIRSVEQGNFVESVPSDEVGEL